MKQHQVYGNMGVHLMSGCYMQAWAASLPTALLRLPYSFVESLVLSCIIYWVSGLAPEAARWALTFRQPNMCMRVLMPLVCRRWLPRVASAQYVGI